VIVDNGFEDKILVLAARPWSFSKGYNRSGAMRSKTGPELMRTKGDDANWITRCPDKKRGPLDRKDE
jgi:hypothetical protein